MRASAAAPTGAAARKAGRSRRSLAGEHPPDESLNGLAIEAQQAANMEGRDQARLRALIDPASTHLEEAGDVIRIPQPRGAQGWIVVPTW